MKIRTNFVSNSSSSSFVCEVCGEAYGGWDATLEDANMCECVHDHVMCTQHLIDKFEDSISHYICSLPLEELRQLIIEEYGLFLEYSLEEIQQADNADTLIRILQKRMPYFYESSIPARFCPVCQLESISDGMLLKFILRDHLQIERNVLEQMLRGQYKSSEEFWNRKS